MMIKLILVSLPEGWLDKFKKRAQLHNIKVIRESASIETAHSFPKGDN